MRFTRIHTAIRLTTVIIALWLSSQYAYADEGCDDCLPRVALKTNLLHDAALTPDLGVEISIARRFSLSVEGVYAWWSKDSRHRYWRVRGGTAEARVWFGDKSRRRALTGHHAGIYASVYDYDFEFGHKGRQAPEAGYSVGVGYGYSFRIAPRLNLDLGVRIGYSAGKVIEYEPQCGRYVCTDRYYKRYFGPTGIDVTLVWFPGKGKRNRPDYEL